MVLRTPRGARPTHSSPHRLADQRGAVFEPTLLMAIIMLVLALAVFEFGVQDAGLVSRHAASARAFYLAEAGLAKGHGWLQAQDTSPEGTEVLHPFGMDAEACGDGENRVWIVPDPSNGTEFRHSYTIIAEGTVGSYTRRLEQDVHTEVFSDFLYFTETEHMPGGGALWFTSADVIDGPLFTNDQISIFGSPHFKSAVQSAYGGPGDSNPQHEPKFLYFNGSTTIHLETAAESNAPHDEPIFDDGVLLGAQWVDYPALSDVFEMRTLAEEDGGLSLTGNYDFVIGRTDEVTGNPMYGYVSYDDGSGWVDVLIEDMSGIIFVNGGLTVQGVLDGHLTFATNGTIRIVDDVTYRDSNQAGLLPHCDDLLGLIAGTDILVSDTDPNLDDCVIHATMVALSNSFAAENWGSGSPRGTLTVAGSIIQSFRGSVGTGSLLGDEIQILTGYAKDYRYDWRLQDIYPPGFYRFLKTGHYTKLNWREIPVG